MLLRDIMIPIRKKDNPHFEVTISSERHIFDLSPAEIMILPEEIGVVDSCNELAGYIEKERIQYLNQAGKGSILEQIMDKYPEGVVAIDTTGRIFYVNDVYPKILGTHKYKVLGKYLQVFEPDAAMLKVCADGEPILDTLIYLKTLERHVRVNVYPIKSGDKVVAAVSIFRDETEKKKMSQALNKAQGLVDYFREQIQNSEEAANSSVIGQHPDFLKVLSQAKIVAKTDVPVLITGENGVGKEVIAKLIHSHSQRSDKPLITINCAAIPENLLESELFGYVEGSFTGAKKGGKLGKFELAEGGTLFLDEIGDMSWSMQSKILRVLQEKEIEKIGRTKNVPVDVRVITATNRSLETLMKQEKFRSDLYYRLNVVAIRIPPLRDRGQDAGLLAYHFLQQCNAKYNKNIVLSVEVLQFIESYSWPGNVREIKNCIEYAVIMCQEEELRLEYMPVHMRDAVNGYCSLFQANTVTMQKADAKEGEEIVTGREFLSRGHNACDNIDALRAELRLAEKEQIQKLLQDCQYNKTEAMKMLGVSRRTFYRKLYELGLASNKK